MLDLVKGFEISYRKKAELEEKARRISLCFLTVWLCDSSQAFILLCQAFELRVDWQIYLILTLRTCDAQTHGKIHFNTQSNYLQENEPDK